MMDGMRRCPDEWVEVAGGPVVPWMVWAFDKGMPASRGNLEHMRRILGAGLSSGRPLADAETVSAMFRFLAIRLQGGKGHSLRAWLKQAFQRSQVSGLRYPYLDEQVAREAGTQAGHMVGRLLVLPHPDFDAFLKQVDSLNRAAEPKVAAVAPNDEVIQVLVKAWSRGIPVRRVSASMPLFRLGQGCRQQQIWRGYTSHTAHIGTVAATHKPVTYELLRAVGLPVARQQLVRDLASARHAAEAIGFPVVVKPATTDYGTAVSVGIRNDAELMSAFAEARRHGAVLVEEMLPGADYRLVVINGRFVSAIRRDPAQICGDGVSDVASLVERMGALRRANPELASYGAASLDDPLVRETLGRQGLTGESIPSAGQTVLLRTNANISTGGTFADVSADLHPDNVRLAERAAACLGLDHAGIDLITPDIRQAWHRIHCGICEVNPTPGMGIPAVQSLVDYLFPAGSNGRIPVVVVIGDAVAAAPVVKVAQDHARDNGWVPGTVLDGVARVNGERACRDARTATELLDIVLADAAVGFAIAQGTACELLQDGLRVSHCDIVVFLGGLDVVQAVSASPRTPLGRSPVILENPSAEALRVALRSLQAHAQTHAKGVAADAKLTRPGVAAN